MNKVTNFLRAVKGEIKKITWPSRAEVMRSTLIVLVVIVLFGLLIGGMDIGIFQIIKFFLRLG